MQISSEHIAHLLMKKLSQQLTPEEEGQLNQWASQSDAHQQQLKELMNRSTLQQEYNLYAEAERRAEPVSVPDISGLGNDLAPVRKLRTGNQWWWAAALVLLIGGSGYFWVTTNKKRATLAAIESSGVDIPPGSNRALLTLSDGTTIVLDSMAPGAIAKDGNASIVKSEGGILYRVNGESTDDVLMNTMRTPNGGQYQLVLPDGSRVWMNAASSITYPTAFSGKERRVTVSGEVYLEVAKNANQPFRVDIKETTIEVLGTSFNVNAYPEEAVIRTTLVDGKVKVIAGGNMAVLQPGQQATYDLGESKPINIKSDVNIEQTMAWKNGLFSFVDADFNSVMKQLERWYNITVKYNDKIPTVTINGEMYRNASFQHVIQFLQRMGIKLSQEGNTLIIY